VRGQAGHHGDGGQRRGGDAEPVGGTPGEAEVEAAERGDRDRPKPPKPNGATRSGTLAWPVVS
jgi:hypothetical protein